MAPPTSSDPPAAPAGPDRACGPVPGRSGKAVRASRPRPHHPIPARPVPPIACWKSGAKPASTGRASSGRNRARRRARVRGALLCRRQLDMIAAAHRDPKAPLEATGFWNGRSGALRAADPLGGLSPNGPCWENGDVRSLRLAAGPTPRRLEPARRRPGPAEARSAPSPAPPAARARDTAEAKDPPPGTFLKLSFMGRCESLVMDGEDLTAICVPAAQNTSVIAARRPVHLRHHRRQSHGLHGVNEGLRRRRHPAPTHRRARLRRARPIDDQGQGHLRDAQPDGRPMVITCNAQSANSSYAVRFRTDGSKPTPGAIRTEVSVPPRTASTPTASHPRAKPMGRSILRTAVAAGVSVARFGLAGVLALSLTLPARAETVRMNARPGQRTFLQGITHYFPGSGLPLAGSLDRARRATAGRTDRAAARIQGPQRQARSDRRFDRRRGRLRSRQEGFDVDLLYGAARFLRPRHAVRRRDLRRRFDGPLHVQDQGGGRRASPGYGVTRAPAPRDGDPGRAAQTAREAPAERAASTGDFLRDTVRQATPTSRPAAAAAPPKAAGTPETDAPNRSLLRRAQ